MLKSDFRGTHLNSNKTSLSTTLVSSQSKCNTYNKVDFNYFGLYQIHVLPPSTPSNVYRKRTAPLVGPHYRHFSISAVVYNPLLKDNDKPNPSRFLRFTKHSFGKSWYKPREHTLDNVLQTYTDFIISYRPSKNAISTTINPFLAPHYRFSALKSRSTSHQLDRPQIAT